MFTKTKIALSALVVLGTASAAFAESWDYIPTDRNPNPVFVQPFEGRNVYEARAQVGAQTPTVYIEKQIFDRASQSFDGAGGQ